MAKTVREPRQERSIEKKNRIIQAGYELFSDIGYHETNTALIAKRAGVSTGIVYGYFRDKKDILREVTAIYMDKITAPILKLLSEIKSSSDALNSIPAVLDIVLTSHKENSGMHEALHSLTHTDPEINAVFIAFEDEITLKIASRLTELGVLNEDAHEKVHFAMDILQSFAHEYVFDHHEYIDYERMKALVIQTLTALMGLKHA